MKREWPDEKEISDEVPGPSEFEDIHGYPIDDEPEEVDDDDL